VSPQNSYADDIRRETFRISLGHEDGVLVKGISIYIYIYIYIYICTTLPERM
jgi:hypothetical protein